MLSDKVSLTQIIPIINRCVIAAIILSVIPLLLVHPVKDALYIFILFLCSILILLLFSSDYKFKLNIPNSVKIIDYSFIVLAIAVFGSNVLDNPIGDLRFAFSIVISFFLPGWVLL